MSDRSTRKSSKKKVIITVIVLVILIGTVKTIIFSNEMKLADAEWVNYHQELSVPSTELIEIRTRESNTLNSYAVLDEETGIYRIPITRALEIMADESSE